MMKSNQKTLIDPAFCEQIAAHVRHELFSYVAKNTDGTTSVYSFRAGMILADWAEDERAEFYRDYEGRGCECFISPPCGYCTHPGNPVNQEETDDCWIPSIRGGA